MNGGKFNMILSAILMSNFFENAFSPIQTSFDWGFFFGLFGTLLGILSLLKRKQKKSLELDQADTTYKTQIPSDIKDKLTISYKGQNVESIINTTIFLQNTGNVELKNDDFNNDCVLTFSEQIEVLEYSIQCSDKFTGLKAHIEGNNMHFKISFLEPQVYIKINILYKCDKLPESFFAINLVRGEKKVYNLKQYDATEWEISMSHDEGAALVWTILCFGLFHAIKFLIEKMFGINIHDYKGDIAIPTGWVYSIYVGAFIPTFIIWLKVFMWFTFMRKRWHKIKVWNTIEHMEMM